MTTEEIVQEVTAVMREADKKFEMMGGSTRHYVRDLLIPMLEEKGLQVCKNNNLLKWVDSELRYRIEEIKNAEPAYIQRLTGAIGILERIKLRLEDKIPIP